MLLTGVEIIMRAIGVERAVIGVENNKPDAIAHLRDIISRDNYRGTTADKIMDVLEEQHNAMEGEYQKRLQAATKSEN